MEHRDPTHSELQEQLRKAREASEEAAALHIFEALRNFLDSNMTTLPLSKADARAILDKAFPNEVPDAGEVIGEEEYDGEDGRSSAGELSPGS